MSTALRKQFGERIKALRQSAGWSQEAFADRCGLARSYMSRLERGQGNPSLDALEILASALEVEVRELFPAPAPSTNETPPVQQKQVLVPFAADGSFFNPGLTKPRSNRYYVGTKDDPQVFASFEVALAYLRGIEVAYWLRPNTSGHWSRVKAVRWDVLPNDCQSKSSA